MASWEPVDISQFDHDGIADKDDMWADIIDDLEKRYNKLIQFDKTLNERTDENLIEMTEKTKDALKGDTILLIANQIYDKIITMFNNDRKRFGIQKGVSVLNPIRENDNFKLADDGKITFVDKRTVIDLGNINGRLKSSWEIRKLGVTKLRLMGFTSITDEDVQPYRPRYVKAREKIRKLDENLNERLKAIESSSTTDAEAIEMIVMTSKDIDTTVKDIDTSFFKPDDKDKLLPLRELEGLDKQLRTIKGSLRVAIAKRVDLEARFEHEERKLNEIQDPTYSDDQRNVIEDRINKLRDELNERNEEINILKDEASKQINQIRGSITKSLDKETVTLGERIRTLFKEQGITIVSILTVVGMAIGVLIEALLGNPTVPTTTTSGSTSGGDGKGSGAREWIKSKLKALSRLLGKLADKALASLPGIIGAILSWILNRAKEVIGWLSQNLWALITGVGVLVYTYFMTKTRRR